jgi:outer membrane protein assembly factor BamB
MRLEIVVAPHLTLPPVPPELDDAAPDRSPAGRRRTARDVLDVFIDGANVTAQLRETHGAFVLRDLVLALAELSRRPRSKATVRFYDEPWELCVERFGASACLSVYRASREPLVAVYDRAVPFEDVLTAARDAADRVLADPETSPSVALELESAVAQLRALSVDHGEGADVEGAGADGVPDPVAVAVEPDRDAPLSFGAEFAIREGGPSPRAFTARSARQTFSDFDAVERSDLHALLFRGRVRAEIRGRVVDLGECHPVLVAERLLELAKRAFDAWERGLPLNERGEVVEILIGVRLSADGDLALSLGAARGGARRAVHTFPALGVSDVLEAALAFGRSLVRAILRRDRSQASNLRLGALRRALRESADALRSASESDVLVNASPEPYRACAAALDEARGGSAAPAVSRGAVANETVSRLRYAPTWRAIVPGIDLRATYLCGDRMIVGATSEMWSLHRQTGRVLWRIDVPRGTSVVTPGGIARLSTDGHLCIYDFATGEPAMRTRIVPRGGAPVAGAVVHLPGLPRLMIVTEGEHHLVAVDLTTGEPRWRWSWRSSRGSSRGAPRMKRAGRLVYFTCGDSALTALDVMTGAIVWRVRDRMRFRTPPTVGRDALFVVSGGAHGAASLYCIDPYSGAVRWRAPLSSPSSPCTVEGAPLVAQSCPGGGAVAVAIRSPGGGRGPAGLTLATFRVEDGSPIRGRHVRGTDRRAVRSAAEGDPLAPVGTSWLAVDDAFIGNSPMGEIVAVDARSGDLRWRHVVGPRPLEADVPRRLEPVLRSGALFVPCSLVAAAGVGRGAAANETVGAAAGVCIVRPSDGTLLGTIAPTEAIPDLLRVDEHCHVYTAEESGHLAAFGALPRLTLVRS